MKLDFKTVYWIVVLIGTSILVYIRSGFMDGLTLNGFDKYLLIVWALLILLPIVKEVSLFGMSIKSDIEKARNDLSEKINSVKYELSNSISNVTSTNAHQTINISPHVSEQLKEARTLKKVVEQEYEERNDGRLVASAKEYLSRVQSSILADKQVILYLKTIGYQDIQENESIATKEMIFEFDGYIPASAQNGNTAQIFEICQFIGQSLEKYLEAKIKYVIEFVSEYEKATKKFAEGILVLVVRTEAERSEAKKYIQGLPSNSRYLKTCEIIEASELPSPFGSSTQGR